MSSSREKGTQSSGEKGTQTIAHTDATGADEEHDLSEQAGAMRVQPAAEDEVLQFEGMVLP
jgi:hypothetical protein